MKNISGILRVIALCLSAMALLCAVLAFCQDKLELIRLAEDDDDFDDFEDWDD